MRHWFQNLNDNKEKIFHFRGSVTRDTHRHPIFKYEACSGPALKLEYSSGEDGPMIILGLFAATFYLTSKFFKIPLLAYGRDYGFYFHNYTLNWKFGTKPMEWDSRTPKWRSFSFHIDDFFLGKSESIERELNTVENVKFKIGQKDFLMNSISWKRVTRFRRHIPFTLFNRSWISVEMKIDKPPMRAGKGENSYDREDDGSFGISMEWKHKETPRWDNSKFCSELAVKDYISSVMKDAKRYGSGHGERGISARDSFEVCL